jgi:hypothetical protein
MKIKTRTSPTCCLHTYFFVSNVFWSRAWKPSHTLSPAGRCDVKHATLICSPSNRKRSRSTPPDLIRRRHQKEPSRSHRWCQAGTPSSTALRRLGEGKWPPLGSNGVRSLEIQHCLTALAALLGLWMLRRPGVLRMIRKIGKSALQRACRRASLRAGEGSEGTQKCNHLPRVAYWRAWPGDLSWSRGSLDCGQWSLCVVCAVPASAPR